tara:strand:- start:1581 stop:1916 length:336 start_codon:yes stop_codon:yes gene_type:complete
MKIIDKAKAHFDGLEIKEIEIPEWSDGDEILKVYAKPLTLAEMSKLQRFAKDDDVALMAYCLIHKALDSDGEKVFDLSDKNALMNNVDKDVLARVATEIMSSPTYEQQAKK